MTSLIDELRSKLAPCVSQKVIEIKLDHPCKETCSGWKQGHERGQLDENKRLAPIHEALLNCVEALEKAVDTESLPSLACPAQWEALDNLKKALEVR